MPLLCENISKTPLCKTVAQSGTHTILLGGGNEEGLSVLEELTVVCRVAVLVDAPPHPLREALRKKTRSMHCAVRHEGWRKYSTVQKPPKKHPFDEHPVK